MFEEANYANSADINQSNDGAEFEFHLAQFKALGRKYFRNSSELHTEPVYILKGANRFFSLAKNSPIDEFFIRLELAPFFWLYDSSTTKYIKNFYKLDQRVKSSPTGNSLISFLDFYEKWVKAKTEEDKKYFAGAALHVAEQRSFTKNSYLQLLHATIKIFDKNFFNPVSASEILTQTFENISSMNLEQDVKNEICYYINLYNGFSQLVQNEPEKADMYFTGALVHKSDGINAKFYSMLADAKQLNLELVAPRFVELYETDLSRFKYALEQNNSSLFTLLCEYNITQNIFAHEEFANVVVEINQEITNRLSNTDTIQNFLKGKIIAYNHISHLIPQEPTQINSIQTIDFVLHKFINSKNLGFLSSLIILEEKFVGTIREIISKIEGEYEKQIEEKLNSFNLLVQESSFNVQQLNNEFESVQKNVKSKVDKMLAESKFKIDSILASYEDKIKHLDQVNDLNPLVTFKNGMSYSLFISLIVLLVVGFASYSNNEHITEISNFKSMFSTVIFAGSKWAIVAFFIGLVFSAVQAGSTVMDRNYRRQGLVKKIQELNERRSTEISEIKKEGEVLEKKMIERIKEKIKAHEHRINSLLEEKEKEAVNLRQKFQEQMNEDTKELIKLLEN